MHVFKQRLPVIVLVLAGLSACNVTPGKNRAADRPAIHLHGGDKQMGIPAGFVYAGGTYHFFYRQSGSRAWAHAVSRDLLNWNRLPPAALPDSAEDIIPGSIVYDSLNRSGLGGRSAAPFIAYYLKPQKGTRDSAQDGTTEVSLAYSVDSGRTWLQYKGNPVIAKGALSSGPRVFWHDATRQWIMCLAADESISFYSSPDGLHWKYRSNFAGSEQTGNPAIWQFPDLFPLQAPDASPQKWVLLVNETVPGGSDAPVTKYIIGDFDGERFRVTQPQAKKFQFLLDYGEDFSAGIICGNAPGGQRILTGLMDCGKYAKPDSPVACRSAAAFPRELKLVKDGFLYLLTAAPVSEIKNLYGRKDSLQAFTVPTSSRIVFNRPAFNNMPSEIRLDFDISRQDWIGFPLSYGIKFQNSRGEYYTIKYENDFKGFAISRKMSGGKQETGPFDYSYDVTYRAKGPVFSWRIILDHTSVEFFADSSRMAVTNLMHFSEPVQSIELFSERSPVQVLQCSITELRPVRSF
jgi:fructan beta-fructosidase